MTHNISKWVRSRFGRNLKRIPFVHGIYMQWRRHHSQKALEAVANRYDREVQAGPFAGMRFIELDSAFIDEAVTPKILGCYEEELHFALETLIQRGNYHLLVNIGCAEGYYAVGLARRLPDIHGYAFDALAECCRTCEELAKVNAVSDQLTIEGKVDVDQLEQIITQRALILIDCEGCEIDLLQPEHIPALTYSDILVEVHDNENPMISETLIQRFSATHQIETIYPTARQTQIYPNIQFLKPIERVYALWEHREQGNFWLIMTANGKNNNANQGEKIE